MRPIRTLLAVLACAAAALGVGAAAAGAVAPAWSAPATYAPADDLGSCLRGAGADRLAIVGQLTATTAATDLLTLAPGDAAPSLAVDATATLGWLTACAEVAVAVGEPATGAQPLLAGPVHVPGGPREVRAGAPGEAPVTVRRIPSGAVPGDVRVALAADGAAMVAWVEIRRPWGDARLMTALRPRAGAPFGPAQLLDRRMGEGERTPPQLGIDASGRATVAWYGAARSGAPSLLVAEADADGRFGRPVRIDRHQEGGSLSLAVAADGRTLLVAGALNGIGIYERRPAERRFSLVSSPDVGWATEHAVALGRDGEAVVALKPSPDHVVALHRAAGAARFSVPRTVAGRTPFGTSYAIVENDPAVGERPHPQDEWMAPTLGAAIGGDGRALLTWTEPGTRWRAAAAMAAEGDTTQGFSSAAPLGSRCRAATSVRPVPLAGGELGVAWTDLGRLRGDLSVGGMPSLTPGPPPGDGRLSAAVPAAAAATPRASAADRGTASPATAAQAATAPRVTARVVGRRTLRIGEPLRLRVACPRGGAPCAVRATVDAGMAERRDGRPRRFGYDEQLSDATTLAPGATAVLRLDPSPGMRIAPLEPRRTAIALTSCAATGNAAVRSTLRPRLRGLPRSPAPRLLDVRAVRRDGVVRITGRLTRGLPDAHLIVDARPGGTTIPFHRLSDRPRFAFTLDEPAARGFRSVRLFLGWQERWQADRVTVRVLDARRR